VPPLEVGFEDLSDGEITSWSWDFGDGSGSTDAHPTHVYADLGTYDVTLSVSGPYGADTLLVPGLIQVVDPDPPEAAFTGAPTLGEAPLPVAFTDLTTGVVTSWSWDFGDGTKATEASPQHVYADPGVYSVSLVASGPGGADVEILTDYVCVASQGGLPRADFAVDPPTGLAPLTVHFDDLSTGDITSWSWDLGNGLTSTSREPTRVYNAPVTYTVTLAVEGPLSGDTVTREAVVTVTDGAAARQASIEQSGVTWSFDAEYSVGRFATGDCWVVGPVTVTSIDPLSTVVAGRTKNGAMVNPVPNPDLLQGYDTILFGEYDQGYYSAELNVALDVSPAQPLVLAPGSSLLSSISHDEPERYQLRAIAVLTVLDAPPPPGSFRPPYVGDDKAVRFNASQLDRSLLAQLEPTASTPSMESVEQAFGGPWTDYIPGWLGEALHATENMPGYGRDVASAVSEAALMLHLDFSDAEKETLFLRYVQLGIDLFGIVRNGGQLNWVPNGGHASGRKWPILFAGLALGDLEMAAIGLDPATSFGEDGQTFFVEETSPGVYNHGYGGYGPADVGLPEWGIRHSYEPELDSISWPATYRQCCTANAWNGFVLAARIMGVEALWNDPSLFAYMDRYIPTSRQIGDPEWQTSWSPFTIEVWDRYRSEF
jgi:PKD repeat protein